MTIKKVIILSVLAFILIFSLSMNKKLYRDIRELKSALSIANSRIEDIRQETIRQNKIIEEREKQINDLANAKYTLNKKLQEMKLREEEVLKWADTHIPDSVNSLLRENNRTNNSSVSSGSMQ